MEIKKASKKSYLEAFLKDNQNMTRQFVVSLTIMTKRKVRKKHDRNQMSINICEYKIDKQCYLCKEQYSCDKDEKKTSFCQIFKETPPEGEIWFGNRYKTKKFDEFICRQCIKRLITCIICGDIFDYNSITTAYNDPGLTKVVELCISCCNCEACSGCGYLAGASPCRWCRRDF